MLKWISQQALFHEHGAPLADPVEDVLLWYLPPKIKIDEVGPEVVEQRVHSKLWHDEYARPTALGNS